MNGAVRRDGFAARYFTTALRMFSASARFNSARVLDSLSLQAGYIDRRFTRQASPVDSLFTPEPSLRAGQKLVRRLLDHRLDVLFTYRLAFEPGGPLDQGDELLRLPLRLLPFQIAGIRP